MQSNSSTAASLRRELEAARDRVRTTAWPILQCSLAAMLAWLLASEVLGHRAPIFAAIAATVCLGVSYGQRLRRVVELAVGVTIGVAIGDILISWIGRGWWQIAVVVGFGMIFAQLLGGGALITAQAGLQGIFLIGLPQGESSLGRWQDALVGGTTALAVAALLPADPSRPVEVRAQALIGELADVVRQAAAALRSGNADDAEAALDRARRTQDDVDGLGEALSEGEEISRISPLRRNRRASLARYRRAWVGVDRAARNLRVAVRRIVGAIENGERVPLALADVLDDLAASLGALTTEIAAGDGADVTVGALTALARRLDPDQLCADSLSATVIVGQVRSAVVDLLEATGMEHDRARELLPH